jgi:hypothetical protein
LPSLVTCTTWTAPWRRAMAMPRQARQVSHWKRAKSRRRPSTQAHTAQARPSTQARTAQAPLAAKTTRLQQHRQLQGSRLQPQQMAGVASRCLAALMARPRPSVLCLAPQPQPQQHPRVSSAASGTG